MPPTQNIKICNFCSHSEDCCFKQKLNLCIPFMLWTNSIVFQASTTHNTALIQLPSWDTENLIYMQHPQKDLKNPCLTTRGDSCVMSAGGDRARVAEELARQQEQEDAGAGGYCTRVLPGKAHATEQCSSKMWPPYAPDYIGLGQGERLC